jgi:thiamine pyrophosphokinase
MSSHHIVREKQEPALLVLGMEHFTDELLGQLLEWSPTLITTPGTAEKLTVSGIKIDVIVGSAVEPEDLQSDVKYIRASDNNYTVAALTYLISNNYPAVNVVTDEFLLDDYVAFADKINLVIYCGNQKIYPVISGFSKWKPADEVIELMSTVPVKTTGLENIAPSQYKTTADGFFNLQFAAPFIFIAENIL